MKQERLEELNTEVMESVQQYVSGMITIVELTDFMAHMKHRIGEDGDLAGLLDPNTGLRFPTKEETDAFMAQFEQNPLPLVTFDHEVVAEGYEDTDEQDEGRRNLQGWLAAGREAHTK